MCKDKIPFNKPFVAGKELYYVSRAVALGNLGGDGYYTQACCRLLEDKFSIPKVLLTPSCTASLEMAAMLCELEEGDEVIMPSYTFVSTATAFLREGAKPVFVDIRPDTLNIDENLIEEAITERTKAICVVHYGGVSCEMDRIVEIASKYNLLLIEDAAQGVNAFYKGRALGSIGDLGCYSFHETKNFICGEGGALCINNPRFQERAEVIRYKGTNRQQFNRGQVDKYTWVDVGSSFVPSELCSAFLYGQLELMDSITERHCELYQCYLELFQSLELMGKVRLPKIPEFCKSNFQAFYLISGSNQERDSLIQACHKKGIGAVFHYVPLHSSPMGERVSGGRNLKVTDDRSRRLVRLPMFYELSRQEQVLVAKEVSLFYE